MYATAIALFMSAAAQDVPTGLLFNRGSGCNGATAMASTGCGGGGGRAFAHVRAIVESRPHLIRAAIEARPHVLRNVLDNRPHLLARAFAATGCGGGQAMATGCSGGTAFAQTMVTRTVTSTVGVAPKATVGAGGFIERHAVHRVLKRALRDPSLTPDQRAAGEKLINDPDAYDAAVSKIHRDLANGRVGAAGPVGKIGDGTLLKLILDNLPQIMAVVMAILKAFGIG